MRGYLFLLPALLLIGAACDSPTPLDIAATRDIQRDVVPGTGDPAIDALLQTFNNEVVACANNSELDYQTASRLALISAILRFTPTPEQKLDALVQALLLQIENARKRGTITESCAATLTATLNQIAGS